MYRTAAGTVSSTQPDPVSIVPSVPSTAAADWRQLDEFKDNPTRYTKPDNEMKSASIDSPASSTSSDRATSVMNEEPDQLLFSSEGYRNTSKEDLKAINKQHRDAYDRLRSTSEGSEFVTNMVGPYNRPLPVIANLRCGAWYINPHETKVNCTAYFKSTDGHDGQWQFSLRRRVPHLLSPTVSFREFSSDVILNTPDQSFNDCMVILLDFTCRGKIYYNGLRILLVNIHRVIFLIPLPQRFPYPLSKTDPSWCAVINAASVRLLDCSAIPSVWSSNLLGNLTSARWVLLHPPMPFAVVSMIKYNGLWMLGLTM
ncbi:hypothetical protein PSTT_08528 [Puccinia striiformis]|uniref:Rit1 N-terminal domain-containing protein n=1 Tax=Puccinia striiformis TaxID=27350 RepID=A0A2S4VCA2_9BASI|nr:hypothetical protein PSTT_08528 [Puccinia striiformis]